MRFPTKPPGINTVGAIAFAAAAGISVVAASFAADAVEDLSARAVRRELMEQGYTWATVTADGLSISVSGEAPTEALRFRALGAAGGVVDQSRIVDAMTVPDPAAVQAPDFSVEILRNDEGISLIGLIPAASDREAVLSRVQRTGGKKPVTDMLETADNAAPPGWQSALNFGLAALNDLPRAKISISAKRVSITAITDSEQQKQRLEHRLRGEAPKTVDLVLDISAPRPVLTPFTLRFLVDEKGPRFDACSADTEQARARILAAAKAAGVADGATCTVGLGVPSPDWAEAAEAAIKAMAELGAGSVTLSDADVSLIAAPSIAREDFDRVAGELDTALPDVFSLTSVLTPKPEATGTQGPPRVSAVLLADGHVQIRGLLEDERTRAAVESYARARFGVNNVYAATRLEKDLPQGWPTRVLAGLEALAQVAQGSVMIEPDLVRVAGKSGNRDTPALLAALLSDRLGRGEEFEISVSYDEKLDPAKALPTAQECIAGIQAVQKEGKIDFEPGSARLSASAQSILDEIAEKMKDCSDYSIEVAGHTDSQGRDEMNLALSEDRAEAVVDALMQRRVLTSNLHPMGYGEAHPIASNDTETGREANRRIEFTLLDTDSGTAEDTDAAAGPAIAAEDVPVADGKDAPGHPQPRPETADDAAAEETGEAFSDAPMDMVGEDEGGDEAPMDGPMDGEAEMTEEDATEPPAAEAEPAAPGEEATGEAAAEAVGEAVGEAPAEAPADASADSPGDPAAAGTAEAVLPPATIPSLDGGPAEPALGSPEAVRQLVEGEIVIEVQTPDADTVTPPARPAKIEAAARAASQ